MNKVKIYVVPHTHWDREWYFTKEKSTIYLNHTIKEAVNFLKQNSDFKHFLLDAQTSLIDDYLTLNPQDEEIIKSLIQTGRIITGPWYTQTDLLVISGESISRNLFYGIKRAKELGKCMMVGYVPDSFGQSAQMPQIYRGFGIDKSIFRRGKAETQINRSEFYWVSPEGSKVFAHNIIDYGNMINPPNDSNEIIDYFNEKIEELSPLTDTNIILLTNGQDQRPIRKDLPDILNKAKNEGFEIEISDFETILDEMENNINAIDFSGEFIFGQKSRVHKSIFSTRADLKIMNNKLENKIVNIVEPMCTILYSLGFEYQHNILEQAWKLLLSNAAHDSIGMCNSDTVNDNIMQRYKKANELCDNLLDLTSRLFGQKIHEKDAFQFQVFNLLPYDRNEVVKAKIFTPSEHFEILDDSGAIFEHCVINTNDVTKKFYENSVKEIGVNGNYSPKWYKENSRIFESEILIYAVDIPAMGYKTLYFNKTTFTCKNIVENYNSIENEHLKVTLNDGICVHYKEKNLLFNNFIEFEDTGDDGDTYDYSLPRHDNKYIADFKNAKNIRFDNNSLVQSMTFNLEMQIPQNLIERKNKNETKTINISVKLSLNKGEELLNVNFDVDNTAIEHRLRVVFNTNLECKHSIADMQFGAIKRNNYINEVEIWQEQNYVEKPRSIEPLQSFVTLKNEDYGIAVITDCVREYEILNDSKIAMTAFRSVAYMGKNELLDRPGRASGMPWETPNATLLKKISFNYAVSFYSNQQENYIAKLSKQYLTPLKAFQAAEFKNNYEYFILNNDKEKNIPANYSLMKFNKNNAVLSAFKKAENSDDFIVRIFNGNLQDEIYESIDFNASINSSFVSLEEIDLPEDINNMHIPLKASQFKTIKFN